MTEVLIGMGGNLGDVRATLDCAINLLCRAGDIRVRAQSCDYRTPPWGIIDQPAFINRCLAVETEVPARILLDRALAIEDRLGRDRANARRWGPRPIDIDILSYDDLILDEPGLRLPHPELLQRAFVLVPLAEIAPHRVFGGTRVCDALARVDTSGIERLAPRPPVGDGWEDVTRTART
jgi:2-amino-4-hydroxy-6-hydroxymethyldihydropteridine diphosphokinase